MVGIIPNMDWVNPFYMLSSTNNFPAKMNGKGDKRRPEDTNLISEKLDRIFSKVEDADHQYAPCLKPEE